MSISGSEMTTDIFAFISPTLSSNVGLYSQESQSIRGVVCQQPCQVSQQGFLILRTRPVVEPTIGPACFNNAPGKSVLRFYRSGIEIGRRIPRRSLGGFPRPPAVPSQSFCGESGRLPTLNDGLDYIGRQEGQTNQPTCITYVKPLTRDDLSKRLGPSGAELIEPAMRPRAPRASFFHDCDQSAAQEFHILETGVLISLFALSRREA
jgi:hypothetical protein